MAIIRLFRLPRNKRFNYQPLYYDPEKEEKQERMRRIESELGIKREVTEGYRTTITRGSMRSYFHKNEKARKQSNFRLVIIILFLLFVAYLILFR
jgi:hypothetical protein